MDQRSRDFVRNRLADPAWLVRANPRLVIASLESAADRTQLLAAAVYRTSAHLHQDSSAAVRRQVLSLDAARIGERALAARISEVSVDGEPAALWRVRWVGGPQSDPRLVRAASGRTGEVLTVASATSAGRKIVISGIDDGTVRLWDLLSGKQLGEPLVGHSECVLAVAGAVRDGRLVAVTGSDDGVLRIFDVATGLPVGGPLVGHSASVRALTVSTVDGRPLAVSGGWDQTVRIWDLSAEQRPVGRVLAGHRSEVWAVATTEVYGRALAVTGGGDGTARVWDVADAQQCGEPLNGHDGPVHAVATAQVEGRPVAVTGGWDGTLRTWDLRGDRRRQLGRIRTGHDDPRWAVAAGTFGSRAIAATGGGDGRVRIWNLRTLEQIGPDLVFPSAVRTLATAPGDRLVVGFDREVAVLEPR